jgi:hypothetical protein
VIRIYDAAEFTESHNNLSNRCPEYMSKVNHVF